MADGTITLSKPPIVTYKKKKHPRAFRIWDSNLLNTAMIQAASIKDNLEQISAQENQTLLEMKPSLLPSHTLYHLVESFLLLYETQVKEGLIQTGSPKIQPTLH